MYMAIKHIHLACVVLSGLGFLLRGLWVLMRGGLPQWLPVRVLPHVVDTLLLVSAITLAAMSGQYPPHSSWITAKIVGLLVYIVLGTVALKRGRTPAVRAVAFVGALAVFAWIVSVALTRNPAGYLAGVVG